MLASKPESNKPKIENLHVIGCGGVASYLLPVLLKTFAVSKLTLHDGDTLEARNLDRQLFLASHIGSNKARALGDLLVQSGHIGNRDLYITPEFFHDGSSMDMGALIICCVDNHAARVAALRVADMNSCCVIIAANEYTDASAAFYTPSWRGTKYDPRIRYPEMNTDDSDNPLRPESCQGAAQQRNSQLAMANFSAADHAVRMAWYWLVESVKLDKEIRDTYSPIEFSNNFSRTKTTLLKDIT